MRNVMLILGCSLVLILRKGEWNELIGYSKDCGKDRPNSRTNSLQRGKNDADQILFQRVSVTALNPVIERIRLILFVRAIDKDNRVHDRAPTCARSHSWQCSSAHGALCYIFTFLLSLFEIR
jgi:hypothetical protein